MGGSVAVDAEGDPRGAGVRVPGGALRGPARLTLSQLRASPTLPNMRGRSRAVHFGPSGTAVAQPATIMLPLPENDGALSMANLAAFVWNTEGRGQRVQVLSIDTQNKVMTARARHSSIYVAAQSTRMLETSLARAGAGSACEGALLAPADVTSGLEEATLASVNNLPERLAGGTPDTTPILELLTPSVEGSLRVVQVFELVEPHDGAELPREQRLIATTVYFSGDGTATLTHADALGNLLEQKRYTDLSTELAELQQRLSGAATQARFKTASAPELAIAARTHVSDFQGDASRDPVCADELGLAATERAPVAYDAAATAMADVDCDGVRDAFDAIDERLLPRIEAEPSETVRLLSDERVVLHAHAVNGDGGATTSWTATGPQGDDARLIGELPEQPSARAFQTAQPGRYVVSFRATIGTQQLENDFSIEGFEPPPGAQNQPPSCMPTRSLGAARIGKTMGLAHRRRRGEPCQQAAHRVGRGDGRRRQRSADGASALSSKGDLALLAPTFGPAYVVGCRAFDGQQLGASGSVQIPVLPAGASRAPEELTLTPGLPAELASGETLALTAYARDPDVPLGGGGRPRHRGRFGRAARCG